MTLRSSELWTEGGLGAGRWRFEASVCATGFSSLAQGMGATQQSNARHPRVEQGHVAQGKGLKVALPCTRRVGLKGAPFRRRARRFVLGGGSGRLLLTRGSQQHLLHFVISGCHNHPRRADGVARPQRKVGRCGRRVVASLQRGGRRERGRGHRVREREKRNTKVAQHCL